MELHKSDVNVESFIDSCVSIFHTPARGKDITIKLELCDLSVDASLSVNKTDSISLDKFKVSQVLRNFMSNAMKFTPYGGTITVRACFTPDMTKPLTQLQQPSNIEMLSKKSNDSTKSISQFFLRSRSRKVILASSQIDVEMGNNNESDKQDMGDSSDGNLAQQGILRISVIDSGAGISPENQKRLFKEIVQFNPEVLQGGGGSGFGLYICKGIVDLHDGSIDVYSAGIFSVNTSYYLNLVSFWLFTMLHTDFPSFSFILPNSF